MQNLSFHSEQALQALHACSYFSTLGPEILKELTPGLRLLRYQSGEVIFWEGENCSGLHILEQGSAKIFKISPQGRRELIIRVIEKGTSFNEVGVFDYGPNPVNVGALEDCLVWVVSPDTIRKALLRHPELAQVVITNLTQNLRRLVGMVEELSFFQVTHRLARLIQDMPPEQLSGGAGQRLTQDEMAARLGTVREVVARSLRELERSGAIQVQRRQIRVTDHDRLQEWTLGPV